MPKSSRRKSSNKGSHKSSHKGSHKSAVKRTRRKSKSSVVKRGKRRSQRKKSSRRKKRNMKGGAEYCTGFELKNTKNDIKGVHNILYYPCLYNNIINNLDNAKALREVEQGMLQFQPNICTLCNKTVAMIKNLVETHPTHDKDKINITFLARPLESSGI